MAEGYQGPPAVNIYGMLSGLGDTLQNNAKIARDQKLRDAFKDGLPRGDDGRIDFDTIGNIASQHGADLPTILGVAKLGEEQRKSREEAKSHAEFTSRFGSMFGGGTTPTPAASPNVQPGAPPADPMAARAPLQPTAKSWGDQEATDAGLYEPAPKTASFGGSLNGKKPTPAEIVQPVPPGVPATDFSSVSKPAAPQAPAPATSGYQGPSIEHVPQLVAAMSSPRLPAADREIAKTFLTRALDDAKEPDKIRTLKALKEQSGYTGTILDLERELRKSSKTDVTVDQRGENEEAKAAGKAAGERRASMMGAANLATNNLASLTRVQTLLDRVDQGALAQGKLTIGRLAEGFGVNRDFAKSLGLDPAKLADSQALQSMFNELVVGKLGPGGFPSNNFSDSDRAFLTDIMPKLSNEPRANKLIVEIARRVHQDSISKALDYQTWKEDPTNKGKGFEDFELGRARNTSKMDRFGDLRKQAEELLQTGGGSSAGEIGGIGWRVK